MVTNKDMNRSLSEKLGFSAEKKSKTAKTTTSSPAKKGGGKKKKNPWSSSDEDGSDSGSDVGGDMSDVEKKSRDGVRRKPATTKYKDYMSSDSSDSDDLFTNGNAQNGNGHNKSSDLSNAAMEEDADKKD